MFPKIHLLAKELGLSEGELLKFARQVLGNGRPVRMIDLLTREEGDLIIAELEAQLDIANCASLMVV